MYIKLSSSEGLLISMKMLRIQKLTKTLKDNESLTLGEAEFVADEINKASDEVKELIDKVRNKHITVIPEETLTDEQKEMLK